MWMNAHWELTHVPTSASTHLVPIAVAAIQGTPWIQMDARAMVNTYYIPRPTKNTDSTAMKLMPLATVLL